LALRKIILLTSLDKDTCIDGGEFEAGEVLNA